MIVRRAVPSDVPALARVHIDTWRATYRGIVPDAYLDSLNYNRGESGWKRMLSDLDSPEAEQSGKCVLVAESPDCGVVGFASFGPNRDQDTEHDGELYAIYVLPTYQGRGAGRELISETARMMSVSGFRSMVVWVLSANPARRFYERSGGSEVRQRKIKIGGVELDETAYGWADLSEFGRPVIE